MNRDRRKRSLDVAIPLGVDGARIIAVVRCDAKGGGCRSQMGLVWALPRRTDDPAVASAKLPDFVLINDTGVPIDEQPQAGRRLSRREQLIRARWTRQEELVRGEDLARDDFDGWTDIFLCFEPARPRPNRLLSMGHNAYVHTENGLRVETLGGHGLRFGELLKMHYAKYLASKGAVQDMRWAPGADTVLDPRRRRSC